VIRPQVRPSPLPRVAEHVADRAGGRPSGRRHALRADLARAMPLPPPPVECIYQARTRYFLLALPLLTWLIQGAVGPALVGLPVTWAASDLAGAARGWVRRPSDRRNPAAARTIRLGRGSGQCTRSGDARRTRRPGCLVRNGRRTPGSAVRMGLQLLTTPKAAMPCSPRNSACCWTSAPGRTSPGPAGSARR
jgi:hypothetical protein